MSMLHNLLALISGRTIQNIMRSKQTTFDDKWASHNTIAYKTVHVTENVMCYNFNAFVTLALVQEWLYKIDLTDQSYYQITCSNGNRYKTTMLFIY